MRKTRNGVGLHWISTENIKFGQKILAFDDGSPNANQPKANNDEKPVLSRASRCARQILGHLLDDIGRVEHALYVNFTLLVVIPNADNFVHRIDFHINVDQSLEQSVVEGEQLLEVIAADVIFVNGFEPIQTAFVQAHGKTVFLAVEPEVATRHFQSNLIEFECQRFSGQFLL